MSGSREEFTVTLDGIEYSVAAEGNKIVVNDRPFRVSVEEDGSVLVDGIGYELELHEDSVEVGEERLPFDVSGLSLGGAATAVDLASVPAAEATADAGAVLAIMPGKITWVMVEEGDEVEEGQAVCVLEAMKMENELRVEGGGVVTAVHVKPGDDVEKNQLLVQIE